MAGNPEVYVDTSAFIAFLDRSDSHHSRYRQLFSRPPRLVTTSLVVCEGYGWFLRRYDQQRALQFLAFLEDCQPLEITAVGPAEIRSAAEYLRKFADHPLTLADAMGLYIMRQRKIDLCWSTDRHLSLAGARLLSGG
ncbi:MAG: type II toxin-antitoxin system VapC family toxin [Bradymonadales bacterium]|nr:type II toxin-antitoxin system VapC family toxin [Bradymonadales bacterium]